MERLSQWESLVVALLVWAEQPAIIRCPVCQFHGDGVEELTVSGASPGTLRILRCPRCRSVVIEGEMFDIDLPEAVIDGYVENGAGIEAIARNLFYLDPSSIHSFLDVGSNYGFGAHLGRSLLGWDVIGIEPGSAGRKGARELQLPIRDEFLLEHTVFDRKFDFMLASEVLEHVPDPAGFLKAIAAQVAPGGHLVLTTPAAEIVDRAENHNEIIIAVSPGYHLFLASAEGLERLLHEAGFASVLVKRDHRTLRAIASLEPDEALAFGDFGPSSAAIEGYYDRLASEAPAGSALSSGMASRHFRALVNRGDFAAATESLKRATSAIQLRHGLDASDPVAVIRELEGGRAVPWNLIPVAYHAGMMQLITGSPSLAVPYFDLTMVAARSWERQSNVLDGDSADLALNAARHRALAFCRFEPARVEEALAVIATMDNSQQVASWTRRLFSELVARDHPDEAAALLARLDPPELGLDEDIDDAEGDRVTLLEGYRRAVDTGAFDRARKFARLLRGHSRFEKSTTRRRLFVAGAQFPRLMRMITRIRAAR
jgi:SAM-dependent methyltransferase